MMETFFFCSQILVGFAAALAACGLLKWLTSPINDDENQIGSDVLDIETGVPLLLENGNNISNNKNLQVETAVPLEVVDGSGMPFYTTEEKPSVESILGVDTVYVSNPCQGFQKEMKKSCKRQRPLSIALNTTRGEVALHLSSPCQGFSKAQRKAKDMNPEDVVVFDASHVSSPCQGFSTANASQFHHVHESAPCQGFSTATSNSAAEIDRVHVSALCQGFVEKAKEGITTSEEESSN